MITRHGLITACLSFLAAFLSAGIAHADFDCAGSPDGKWLVAGGDNRTIFVLATDKWEVKQRIWIGARIKSIQFTSDGKRCLVLGGDKALRVFSSGDWSLEKTITGMMHFSVARNAPVAIGKTGSWRESVITVWSTESLKMVKEIPTGKSIDRIAISHDGKTAYARSTTQTNAEEKESDAGPEPSDRKAKAIWKMKKDGRVTDAYTIDLMEGRIVDSIRCFDSSGNYRIYPTSSGCAFASYYEYTGLWNRESNEYRVVSTKTYAYGSGQASNGMIYTGSLSTFLSISEEGVFSGQISTEKLPGFPEYLQAFSPLARGRIAGFTDAYRVIVINTEDNSILRYVNVY